MVEGRAETPEQKREVIERLYAAWLKLPQMRLGQLLSNAGGQYDDFYTEDFVFVDNIETYVYPRQQTVIKP